MGNSLKVSVTSTDKRNVVDFIIDVYKRQDQCVTKLEIENKVTVYGDISYTFPAYFGYQ